MTSKFLQRFNDKVFYFKQDLELADMLVQIFIKGHPSQLNISAAYGNLPGRYSILEKRKNIKQSKMITGRHLNKTLYVSFVKDLYEEFSIYLTDIMKESAKNGIDPNRFVGDAKFEINAIDILKCRDWESTLSYISEKIFRSIEDERSTITLIRKISRRLGVQIDKEILDSAMPYLDSRHIFVHRDGICDEIFMNKYPEIRVDVDSKIVTDFEFVTNAELHVSRLAKKFDDQITELNLVK